MDSFKKQTKKRYVPWFNSSEWFNVFNLIYGKGADETTQRKALNMLKMWKCRTPLLQAGVEGTLIILRALLLDKEKNDSYNLRLIQSTSIMRFLNICAANDNRQGTFYQTAKKRKIPEWIISLRHDAAHSQNLPMADILNNALNFCLNWLYTNYWSPVSSCMQDYVDKYNINNIEYEDLKSALEPFVTNYAYINLSTHPKWNYSAIGDVPDTEVRSSIVAELKAMLKTEDINDKTKLQQVLHKLWVKIEKQLQIHYTKRKMYALPELLLEGEIFLGDVEQFGNEKEVTTLPQSFLFLWEKLLKNIHIFGMIPALLEKLLDVVNNEQETEQRRKVAALWIAELGKAFRKCIVAQNSYKKMSPEMKNKMSAKYLNIKLKNECETAKPHMKNFLTLGLMSNIPAVFSDAETFKMTFLRAPNEFTNIYMPTLLDLCSDFKCKEMKKEILELNELSTNIKDKKNILAKIYTIEDLASKLNNDEEMKCENDSEKANKTPSCVTTNHNDEKWKLMTDIDFGKCPIGILPWQTTSHNPLLNF